MPKIPKRASRQRPASKGPGPTPGTLSVEQIIEEVRKTLRDAAADHAAVGNRLRASIRRLEEALSQQGLREEVSGNTCDDIPF